MEQDFSLLYIFIFAVIVIISVIAYVYNEIFTKEINANSKRLKAVRYLNEKYCFNSVKECIYYTEANNTKAKFDRFDFDDFFNAVIEEDIDFYNYVINVIQQNNIMYNRYQQDLCCLPKGITKEEAKALKIPFWICENIENDLYNKLLLKPILSTSVHIKTYYQSPAGRNYYEDSKTYSFNQIIEHFKYVQQVISFKNSKEYQRQLLTQSLRYDILKRDNFTCQICGRSKKDGVKLHVDHIIPVSRGGKTEPDNLRTLCQDCNLGKSDKYDEFGIN